MDPSSPYAMAGMVGLKDRFDVAFASDTDADRHGIVSHSQGLLEPNHYLSVAIGYVFANRPAWPSWVAVGKTLVSSSMIDRVAARLQRRLIEVPVGFKWFVHGLIDGTIGFCGEESSGATFLRRDGTVWTTDKDVVIPFKHQLLETAWTNFRRGARPDLKVPFDEFRHAQAHWLED